jgi:hypothetical protein
MKGLIEMGEAKRKTSAAAFKAKVGLEASRYTHLCKSLKYKQHKPERVI